MVGKLSALVLIAGATAASLLSVRQQRVQIAHDLAQLQARIAAHDETIWKLRVQIAERTQPLSVESLIAQAGLDPMAPVLLNQAKPRGPEAAMSLAAGLPAPGVSGVPGVPGGQGPEPMERRTP